MRPPHQQSLLLFALKLLFWFLVGNSTKTKAYSFLTTASMWDFYHPPLSHTHYLTTFSTPHSSLPTLLVLQMRIYVIRNAPIPIDDISACTSKRMISEMTSAIESTRKKNDDDDDGKETRINGQPCTYKSYGLTWIDRQKSSKNVERHCRLAESCYIFIHIGMIVCVMVK